MAKKNASESDKVAELRKAGIGVTINPKRPHRRGGITFGAEPMMLTAEQIEEIEDEQLALILDDSELVVTGAPEEKKPAS